MENQFGKYRLIVSLGQGGMANVFLAVVSGPAGFNKLQVIKRLREDLADEAELLTMFLDEARLAARLNHPNVVQTNEVDSVNGHYFMAMEYLDGLPFNRIIHRLAKLGPIPTGPMLAIVADALAGLHYAHELADYDGTPLNIVHRDISPHNIFVTYEGQTKVVDFGIAKAATRNVETRTGMLKGKVAYMAPEQAKGDAVDRRADIFILGLVVWEIMVGRKTWLGQTDLQVVQLLAQGKIPPLQEARPDAPAEIVRICHRALAPDPADRYQTAAEMRADILAYLESAGLRQSPEEIGKLAGSLFPDRRAEIKALIERQLSGLKAGNVSIVELNSMTSSIIMPRPEGGAEGLEHTPSQRGITPSGTAPSSTVAVEAAAGTRRRGAIFALSIAAVVGAIGVVVMRGSRVEPAPSATAAAPTAVVTAATAAATGRAAGMIEVRLGAEPPEARVFLDDAPLSSNPFMAKFPADGAGHRIRVEAPGYTSQSRVAVFDRDVTIDFKLEAEAGAPGHAGRPDRVAPGAAPPTSPHGPGKPTKRRLDSADPWSN